MRLSAGVPLPTVAANTDTSMKYIQEHYFHYRADKSTEILGQGKQMSKQKKFEIGWVKLGSQSNGKNKKFQRLNFALLTHLLYRSFLDYIQA